MSETDQPNPSKPKKTTAERLARSGWRNLVGHDISVEEIDKALARFDGNRKQAANHLQMGHKRISEAVNQNAMLKAKWGKYTLTGPGVQSITTGQVPTPNSTLSREPLVKANPNAPTVLQSDAELAVAVAREDEKVRSGLLTMGCTADEAELAISLRSFHGRHIEKTVDMMTAGLSLNTLRMLGVIRDLEKRMKEGNFKLSDYGDPVEERMVRESYTRLLEEYRRTTELCLKGSLIKAKIESMNSQGTKTKHRGKPGFRPKGDTTNVIAQNVVIQP